MKGVALGVPEAAAAVAEAEPGECFGEAGGGESRAVVRSEGELAGLDAVQGCGLFDERDRFVGAAAELK